MAWLERSVETGFACWPFFRIDPHLESLREEPEFKRLVSDLEQEYAALKIQRLWQVLRAETARRVVPTKNTVLTELVEFGQP
jgi:hypothetical protein